MPIYKHFLKPTIRWLHESVMGEEGKNALNTEGESSEMSMNLPFMWQDKFKVMGENVFYFLFFSA